MSGFLGVSVDIFTVSMKQIGRSFLMIFLLSHLYMTFFTTVTAWFTGSMASKLSFLYVVSFALKFLDLTTSMHSHYCLRNVMTFNLVNLRDGHLTNVAFYYQSQNLVYLQIFPLSSSLLRLLVAIFGIWRYPSAVFWHFFGSS